MQPLKLKEYLATGKPVVVRNLPAARDWADCLDLCLSPEAFSAAVRDRLRDGLPDDQRQARRRLAGESWAAKAECFGSLADGDVAAPQTESSRTASAILVRARTHTA